MSEVRSGPDVAGRPLELSSVELAHGPLAMARTGAGLPVLLLHQTPRSWDEYRDVLPLLAACGHAAVALDTPGFGASAPLSVAPSIEGWAHAAHAALDALSVQRTVVVGHHTGGVVAVELAAQRPDRVIALVLSSTPLVDAAYRAAPPDESGVDSADDADGLRRSRSAFYPHDRPGLLDRYVIDALRAGPLARAGHRVVGAYPMEDRLKRLKMPVLLIGADADPFAYPQLERLHRALPGSKVAVVAGGMVPLPDGWPQQFATLISNFLAAVER